MSRVVILVLVLTVLSVRGQEILVEAHPSLLVLPPQPDLLHGATVLEDVSPGRAYSFAYDAGDHTRQETSDHLGNVRGSYSVVDPDGVRRRVDYQAGPGMGFVATSEEIPSHSGPDQRTLDILHETSSPRPLGPYSSPSDLFVTSVTPPPQYPSLSTRRPDLLFSNPTHRPDTLFSSQIPTRRPDLRHPSSSPDLLEYSPVTSRPRGRGRFNYSPVVSSGESSTVVTPQGVLHLGDQDSRRGRKYRPTQGPYVSSSTPVPSIAPYGYGDFGRRLHPLSKPLFAPNTIDEHTYIDHSRRPPTSTFGDHDIYNEHSFSVSTRRPPSSLVPEIYDSNGLPYVGSTASPASSTVGGYDVSSGRLYPRRRPATSTFRSPVYTTEPDEVNSRSFPTRRPPTSTFGSPVYTSEGTSSYTPGRPTTSTFRPDTYNYNGHSYADTSRAISEAEISVNGQSGSLPVFRDSFPGATLTGVVVETPSVRVSDRGNVKFSEGLPEPQGWRTPEAPAWRAEAARRLLPGPEVQYDGKAKRADNPRISLNESKPQKNPKESHTMKVPKKKPSSTTTTSTSTTTTTTTAVPIIEWAKPLLAELAETKNATINRSKLESFTILARNGLNTNIHSKLSDEQYITKNLYSKIRKH